MAGFYDVLELEADIFSEQMSEKTEQEEVPELNLELEDGSILTCEVTAVFANETCEYMALRQKDNKEAGINIMKMSAGVNDELKLSPILDEEELQEAAELFYKIFGNEEETV